MFQLKSIVRAGFAMSAALMLAGCNRANKSIETLPAGTTLDIASYAYLKGREDPTIVKPVKDPKQTAQLVGLVNGIKDNWKDVADANLTMHTGIELRFKRPDGSVCAMTIYPSTTMGSYGTNANLSVSNYPMTQTTPGGYPDAFTYVKEVPQAKIDELMSAVGPVEGDMAPKAKATASATPKS